MTADGTMDGYRYGYRYAPRFRVGVGFYGYLYCGYPYYYGSYNYSCDPYSPYYNPDYCY